MCNRTVYLLSQNVRYTLKQKLNTLIIQIAAHKIIPLAFSTHLNNTVLRFQIKHDVKYEVDCRVMKYLVEIIYVAFRS